MLECSWCKKANEPGVKFCLDCGNDLAPQATAEPAANSPRPCGSCGKSDPMNELFCLYCGTTLPPLVVSAEIARNQLATQRAGVQTGTAKDSVLLPVIAGVLVLACGVTGWIGFQQSRPASAGVLIHARPADAAVVIQDQKGFVVRSAELNEDGIFEASSFRPGKYRIMLTADGRESEQHDVELIAGRTISLGIPKPLELKLLPKPEPEPVAVPVVTKPAQTKVVAAVVPKAVSKAVPKPVRKPVRTKSVGLDSRPASSEVDQPLAAVHHAVGEQNPHPAPDFARGQGKARPFPGGSWRARPSMMPGEVPIGPGGQTTDPTGMQPDPRLIQKKMRRFRQMMEQKRREQQFQGGPAFQ